MPHRFENRLKGRSGKGLLAGLILVFCMGSGCSARSAADSGDILGYWKSYRVGAVQEEPGLIRVALDADGRLMQSVIYEGGVQCRIWLDDRDISFKDGTLRFWGNEFKGRMRADKNVIDLVYRDRFGQKIPFMWKRASDPEDIRVLDTIEKARGKAYRYRVPPEMPDGLAVAGLAEEGIDKEKITEGIRGFISAGTHDMHSLLILRHGKLVLEEYFGARGAVHGPGINRLFRDRPQQLASVTKSVNATLVGIARDKGLIGGLDVPVKTYFPEYSALFTGGREKLTLRHLLTMSAGLAWNENFISYSSNQNDAVRLQRAPDMIRYCLEKKLVSEPGALFSYNSGLAIMLGEIVKRATGMPADKFAAATLFPALGITHYRWSHSATGWVHTDGGLALRARDLAKLGLLYLNGGTWKGRRVVSESWVREATSVQILRPNGGYGYQWWTRDYTCGSSVRHAFYAIGIYGQFVTVFPALDLIVVSTAQDFQRGWFARFNRLVVNCILPAVAGEENGASKGKSVAAE